MMDEKKKLEIINEVKQIDREFYLKKSKLASIEAMEYGGLSHSSSLENSLDTTKWKKAISELITLIGKKSVGGDSVEDIRKERER